MVWQVRYYNDHRIQIRIVVWQTFNKCLTIKIWWDEFKSELLFGNIRIYPLIYELISDFATQIPDGDDRYENSVLH